MSFDTPVLNTSLASRRPDRHGKVRDIYDFGDRLLIVATDRISAFDYVLGTGIPDKGKVLTQISAFWFGRLKPVVDNHLLSIDAADFPIDSDQERALFAGRSMLVKRAEPLPIECVARGYLSGSGWKDYLASGHVCGIQLPPGLRESDRLPEPIFTPATKAQTGHDINISEAEAAELVDPAVLARARDLTIFLYAEGAAYAESRGIIVADTKFEFGLLPDDGRPAAERLILIDEVLTPDSSRFWPFDQYKPGGAQPSFDKQFVRDYLEQIKWNKQPPVPTLPEDVVAKTREKYVEAFTRLTRPGPSMIAERLERLVDEMVEKGVQFDDAVREFEKRFISRVLGSCDGSLTKAADTLGIHRNTLTRKMGACKLKKRAQG